MHPRSLPSRLRQSAVARNTAWMMGGQSARMLVLGAYFLVIARSLGAAEYGRFISALTLAFVITPLVGWGSSPLLVKNASRDRSLLAVYWGNGLLQILATGAVLIPLTGWAAALILPRDTPPALIWAVIVTALVMEPVLILAASAFQAVEQMERVALLNTIPLVARLVAAVVFVRFCPGRGSAVWAGFYLAASALAAGTGLWFAHSLLGPPRLALARIRPELSEGFHFSFALVTQAVYTGIDKTLLARLASAPAAGTYGAACRIVEAALIPINALAYASIPRFFQHGVAGVSSGARYALRLSAWAGAYALAVSALLYLAAPAAVLLLGPGYADTSHALRWLALLPCLMALQTLAGQSLAGSGFQHYRSWFQLFIALLSVGLNVWLIPAYSWKGAVWVSLSCQALLLAGSWGMLAFLRGRKAGSVIG